MHNCAFLVHKICETTLTVNTVYMFQKNILRKVRDWLCFLNYTDFKMHNRPDNFILNHKQSNESQQFLIKM